MQTLDRTHRQFILNLLAATHDLTLATVRPDGYPQATVVSYVHDGLTLYAGIGLDSQKAHNIRQNDKVSATVTPTIISVLDYEQGFGHTELYEVLPEI